MLNVDVDVVVDVLVVSEIHDAECAKERDVRVAINVVTCVCVFIGVESGAVVSTFGVISGGGRRRKWWWGGGGAYECGD